MRALLTTTTALLLALAVAGCTALERAGAPAPRTLALSAATELQPARSGPHGVLVVAPPTARAGYRSERIAYRQRDQEIEYFATARWADQPAALVAAAARDALAAAGLFDTVVEAPSAVQADHRLHLELLHLEQDYRDSRPGRARVALRATLTDARGNPRAVQVLHAEHRAQATGPIATAEAAGAATTRLLTRLVRFLARALATAEAPAT